MQADVASADRIVILCSGDDKPYAEAAEQAEAQLKRHGHRVSQVLMHGDVNQSPSVDWRDDVTAALGVGSKAAYWLKTHAPSGVLVGYCMLSDADHLGLTSGRPTIGVTTQIPIREQFKLIRDSVTDAKGIGMLYRRDDGQHAARLAEVRAALPAGARLYAVAIEDHGSMSAAIAALLGEPVDVVWTTPDATIYNSGSVRALLLGALRDRTPVFGFSPAFVRAGALVGTGIDPADQGGQAAKALQEALSGSSGQPIASRQIEPEYQIALNLHVARKLGLTMKSSLRSRATYVFGGED